MRHVFLLIAVLGALVFAVALSAAEDIGCNVTAEIPGGTQVVPITSLVSGAKAVFGNVSFDPDGPADATVTVKANITNGWQASVSPASMRSSDAQTVALRVLVIVAPGQPSNWSGILTLEFRVKAGNQTCSPVTLAGPTFVPGRYLEDVVLVSDDPFSETTRTPGGVRVPMRITAQANAPVAVTFALQTGADLPATGPAPLQIGANDTKWANGTFEVWLDTSRTPSGLYRVIVSVVATVEGGRAVTDSVPLFVRVNDLDPGLASLLGQGLLALFVAAGVAALLLFRYRRR